MSKVTIQFFVLICLCALSCSNRTAKRTPDKYKSVVKVPSSVYKLDTTEIKEILYKMLSEHVQPFRPTKQYDGESKIIMDTLVYSHDRKKMIVLMATRNSTNKLLLKENDAKYFYDANYLYCSRENPTSPILVYDYAGYALINYYNYKDIKEDLRDACFIRLFNDKDPKDKNYNIDDTRFWDSNNFLLTLTYASATSIKQK